MLVLSNLFPQPMILFLLVPDSLLPLLNNLFDLPNFCCEELCPILEFFLILPDLLNLMLILNGLLLEFLNFCLDL